MQPFNSSKPTNDLDRRSRVAIVTGASGGIGQVIATELAAAGNHIAVHYHSRADEAEATVERCKSLGVNAVAIQANLTVEEEVKNLLVTSTQLGLPTILVNNAGMAHYGLLMDMEFATWTQVINVNLTSAFLCTRQIIPYMRQFGQGAIVNISSIHGINGAACEAAYAASKSALIGLTKSLAKELGGLNITVNAVAPGAVDTNMMADFSPSELEQIAQDTPLGRLGQPQDVANVVRFLVSERAKFITGQVISPNGGLVT